MILEQGFHNYTDVDVPQCRINIHYSCNGYYNSFTHKTHQYINLLSRCK